MAYTPTITRSPRPFGVDVAGVAFIPVREGLWRVVSPTGAIRGHIELLSNSGGQETRFAARALRADGVNFAPLGEFWSAEVAADCFR